MLETTRRCLWTLALLSVLSLSGCGSSAQPGSQPAAQHWLIVTDSRFGSAGDEIDQVEAYQQGQPRWAVTLPAPGQALAAANGVVYVGAGETISALDAQTGQVRWHASASPLVRAIQVIRGQVYVDTGGGFTGPESLDVFSPDGRLLWQDVPPSEQDIPAWLVDRGVFYTVVSGFPASLVARDAATGTLLLSAPLQVDSPLLGLLAAGPAALLVVTEESLVLVQRRSGAEVWRRDQTQAVAPQVIGGTVYAFFVDQPGTPGGDPPVFLRALQVSDGRLLWQQPLSTSDAGFLSSGPPLRVGAITPQGAYLLDSPSFSTLHAWNLTNGRLRWTHAGSERVEGLTADAARVYLASDQQLLALQADTGQVRGPQPNPDSLTTLREEAGVLLALNPLVFRGRGVRPKEWAAAVAASAAGAHPLSPTNLKHGWAALKGSRQV